MDLKMSFLSSCAFATAALGLALATAASAAPLSQSGVAAGTPIRLGVALRPRDPAALAALVRAQADPGSPLFRHFLTQAQLRDAFAPSALAYGRTLAALRAQGFRVTRTSPLRLGFDVVAPAGIVERTFATRLARFASAGHGMTIGAATAYTIPAALRADVLRVVGLKAAPRFEAAYVAQVGQPHKRSGSPFGPGGAPTHNLPGPEATAVPLYGPDGGYGPKPVNEVFDLPAVHGRTGGGVRVADIIDGEFSDTDDIAPYLAEFGVKRTGPPTALRLVNGGCGGEGECFDSFQAALDAEGIVGSAPAVAYDVYEIPSLSNLDIVDGFLSVVEDDRADVVNFSVAGCEIYFGEAAEEIDEEAQFGSALGISFETVSFAGSNACGLATPTVQAPADSPNILAVGGADVFTTAAGTLKGNPIVNTGSGGGVSLIFDEPAWQKGARGASSAGRNVPDIAGPAGIDTAGPSIFFGAFGWAGGVPFVDNAPVAAALAEDAQIANVRLGLVSPKAFAVYKSGSAYTKGYFHDVLLGCNGLDGSPYCAKSGFDFASGLGTPDFYKLAPKL
jgi:subtilase family serine protease